MENTPLYSNQEINQMSRIIVAFRYCAVFPRFLRESFTIPSYLTLQTTSQLHSMVSTNATQQIVLFLDTLIDSFNSRNQTDVVISINVRLLTPFPIQSFYPSSTDWALLGIPGNKSKPTYHPVCHVSVWTTTLLAFFQWHLEFHREAYSVLHVNDLLNFINDSLLQTFADDTKFNRQVLSTTDCDLTQKDINETLKWSLESQLQLHVDKTFIVRFHSSKIPSEIDYNYTLDSSTIKLKHFVRTLEWNSQVISPVRHTLTTSYLKHTVHYTSSRGHLMRHQHQS